MPLSATTLTQPRASKRAKKLYNQAAAAQLAQAAKVGEQISASAAVKNAWDTAQKSYIRLVKIARIAFKRDAGICTQLALSGRRQRTLSGWMAQATQFYKNALASEAILTGFKEFGITQQQLQAGLAELKAVKAANLVQEKAKGDAQDATKKRDVALDALQAWLSDFLAIARIALEDQPQLLEGLGLLVRSYARSHS